MPLRITATYPRNKNILFKNRRCKLFGWTLHEEDKERLHRCSTPEMPVRYFNVQVLLNTEAEDKSYRATCSICEASNVDTEHTSEEALRCNFCDKTKPLHAFRPDNHKRKYKICSFFEHAIQIKFFPTPATRPAAGHAPPSTDLTTAPLSPDRCRCAGAPKRGKHETQPKARGSANATLLRAARPDLRRCATTGRAAI